MPAYLLANIENVHDLVLLGEYADLVAPMIESFGGKRVGTSRPGGSFGRQLARPADGHF